MDHLTDIAFLIFDGRPFMMHRECADAFREALEKLMEKHAKAHLN